MSDFVHGTVVGSNHVAEVFDEFPETARVELLDATRILTADIKSAIQADIEASVKPHSGRLERSLRDQVYDDPESVKGRVWSNDGAIAVALEYGAHGTGAVKGYKKRLTHLWANPISGIYVDVPTYSRTQNIAPHSFMRPALASMEQKVRDTYAAALDTAVLTTQEALDGPST